jgi:pyruvate dehydrogenase E2 component (dihydrolipoamide acetyltransferase)
MAAAPSGRAEVDTSRAFRSVKEAVAVFGERIIARETQVRLGVRADHCIVRERSSWRDAVAIASSNEKLEGSHGVRPSDLIREIHSNPSTIAVAIAKHEKISSEPVTNLTPVSYAQPMCLVPLSPPLSAPSPSPAHNDNKQDRKEGNLMIMSSIKKVEEEATKTRQEALQLKKRLTELELAMANLNAKLHRALSKIAHIEADEAAAARASIQQRDNNMVALAVWTEPKLEQESPRRPLGHLLSLDDGDEEVIHVQKRETPTMKRKVQKQKPIVPLVIPLINGMLFSKKKGIQDKESLYMKELYSLLRLS